MNKIVDSRTYKWQKDLLDAAFDERQISPMIKVIVCGGRGFTDLNLLIERLDFYLSNFFNRIETDKVEIVSGTARGADTLAIYWASLYGITVKCFRADWETHGKRAGYLRNTEMAEYATHCIAFWDGQSRGTKHMIDLARKKGLTVEVIRYQ